MRISQFGRHKELKVDVVLNGRVTNFNCPAVAFFNLGLLQDGLNCRVKFFTDVLNKEWSTQSDCAFQVLEVTVVTKLVYFDATSCIHLSDPFVCLALGVDV